MIAEQDHLTGTVEALGRTWEAYRITSDEHAVELKRLGSTTSDTTAKLARIEADLDRLTAQKERLDRIETALRRPGVETATTSVEAEAHKAAFLQFLRRGVDDRLPELERKALSIGNDPDGGYIVPAEMSGRILRRVRDHTAMRAIAGVTQISTEALEGLRDTDEAGAGWVGETGDRPETTTPTLGKWRIPVHELYAEPRATQQMLDDAALDVEAWLADRLADRFARLETEAFATGDGVGRPRGFTAYPTAATDDGARAAGTLQHVSTGVSGDFAASAGADVLFDVVAALRAGYQEGARWVTRRDVLGRIRKMKQGDNYLWQPGLEQGRPATLLGFPLTLMEDLPPLGAGSLSLAFGNFREGYQIVDRVGVRTLRDPFTAKPFVKFYTTKRVGGAVIDFDAIKLVRFAA